MRKNLEKKLGMTLPPELGDNAIDTLLEMILISQSEKEVETPVKPITEPDTIPYSPPAPDDDPWRVPRPLVIPAPKAFRGV